MYYCSFKCIAVGTPTIIIIVKTKLCDTQLDCKDYF